MAPDQTLTFGTTGLTVVYGDNASGKSGYARLLKSLVGARIRDDILMDVFATAEAQEQHALVDYKIGVDTGDREWKWPDGPIAELQQVHFFDKACGDAYLNTESEITYRPSALILLDQLIAVCDAVRAVVERRLSETDAAKLAMPSVPNGTPAARFVAGLKANTSAADIDAQCQAPADAAEQLGKLLSEEARLKASDPTKEQDHLTALATNLDIAAEYCNRLAATLASEGVGQLAKLRTRATELRAAATVASSQDFNAEPVSGVGTATWRALWDAARAFSEAEAYHDHKFPVMAAGSRCVLCQQELSETAAGRLKRFQAFMYDTIERDAAQAEQTLTSSRQSVVVLSQPPPTVLAAIAKVRIADAVLADTVDAWTDGARKRCQSIVAWLDGTEDQPTALDTGLGKMLTDRARQLKAQATAIDASNFADTLHSTSTGVAELQGVIALASNKDVISQEVARLQIRAQIESAKRLTDTGPITRKCSDLTREHVTRQVRDQFTRESERLHLRRITLDDIGGVKGQLLHRPALLGAAKKAPVKKVLSEGEQTALGLSGFFTEVVFDDTKSAIVLDDPVTSLDHERRKYVARRLAELATDRQVVVFTHDLAFVGELAKAAELADINVTERTIERRPDGIPGVCVNNYPWKARDVATRLNDCRTELARIRRECTTCSSEDYERISADWAGKLSETLERIVSVEILSYLVDRARWEVRPKMVRLLAKVTDEDDREYQDVYNQCSQWARRHDKNPEVNYVAPSPDEMEDAIARAQALFDRVRKYRKYRN
ncbi:MAG: AAA family ATPase [Pseudonocardiaceae bacterium]